MWERQKSGEEKQYICPQLIEIMGMHLLHSLCCSGVYDKVASNIIATVIQETKFMFINNLLICDCSDQK